ncbi:amidohydrolase family protein [Pleomorphomonas sp. NRK KF1]|uniref:amidohydrolase family protein n=1 Tax=Pleomorphomonas sp. NRK KF1 TaxID=2943000 RepID=UPI002042C087|nr:amidohydrolase family protein [Pleomorphomonas sp. NRK KF1]MCM5553678.1 amidohydrolase family protein [Pleomorphomonas sp. NRK KF1]
MTRSITIGPDRTGRTVAIVNGTIVETADPAAPVVACPDGEIRPGAVCAHTHLYSGLAPYGMPPAEPAPANFIEILRKVWWRLDRALDRQALRASARDYIAKALLAGTTSLVDHHESPHFIGGSLQVLADAAEDLGVRALLTFGATERNFGRAEAEAGLVECGNVEETPLVRRLVGLHASFTVSDDTIRAAGELCGRLGTVMHVHVAEAIDDVEDARARGYAGPLERLLALDALPPGSILAHGVHLTADEVREADRLDLWFVQNPRSNEGNRVGYPTNLRHSDNVALGCDGWDADMAVEEAALFRIAAAEGDDRATGRLDAGQRLIAERFGFSATGLATGAAGDVVVREDGKVALVVVGGRLVVRDGRLVGADAGAIEAEARAEAARLWQRMATL